MDATTCARIADFADVLTGVDTTWTNGCLNVSFKDATQTKYYSTIQEQFSIKEIGKGL